MIAKNPATSPDGWSGIQSWHIHIGAHKTATTHLQHVLAAESGRMGDTHLILPYENLVGRLDYLFPRSRLERFIPYWKLREARWTRPMAQARHLTDRLPVPPDGVRSVVLSEENLLGPLCQVLQGAYYPLSRFNLSVIGRLVRRAPVTLFLSLRSPDTFFPSAYAEQLHHGPAPSGGFPELGQRLLAHPPSWTQLVRQIRKDAPAVTLQIWRYEDYRALSGQIFKRLTGLDTGPAAEMGAVAVRKGGSAAAVAKAERLDPSMAVPERRQRVSDIYADPALDGPAFRPFTPEQAAFLQQSYAEDVRQIETLLPGALLRPD
jgi:hypothetical protein